MRGRSRTDLVLVLVFCLGYPLVAGAWWRHYSAQHHAGTEIVASEAVAGDGTMASWPDLDESDPQNRASCPVGSSEKPATGQQINSAQPLVRMASVGR
jgi:hypothetical protein